MPVTLWKSENHNAYALLRKPTNFEIGAVLCDMHGLPFHYPPNLEGIKWSAWTCLATDTDLMPKHILYACNKYLIIIDDEGCVACRYDGRFMMFGQFEME